MTATYPIEVEVADGLYASESMRDGRRIHELGRGYKIQVADVTSLWDIWAKRAPIVPWIGAAHPGQTDALCVEINAAPLDTARRVYHVTVRYTTDKDEIENIELSESDPLLRPPTISIGSLNSQEPYYQDAEGVAVLNSAGEIFDPPPMRETSITTLAIVRNEASSPGPLNLIYRNVINGERFAQHNAQQVLCRSVTGDYQSEGSYRYWTVRYEFWLKSDKWVHQILDAGLNEKTEDDGQIFRRAIRRKHLDDEGVATWIPISEPVPLNGQGRELAPGADPFYLYAHPYKTISFLPLGLSYIVGDIQTWPPPAGQRL